MVEKKIPNSGRVLTLEGLVMLSAQFRAYSLATEMIESNETEEAVELRAHANMALHLIRNLHASLVTGRFFDLTPEENMN